MDTTPHFLTPDAIDADIIADILVLGTPAPTWSQLDDIAAANYDGTASDSDRDYWVAICARAGVTCPDGDPRPMDLDTYLNRYTYPAADALIFNNPSLLGIKITYDGDA